MKRHCRNQWLHTCRDYSTHLPLLPLLKQKTRNRYQHCKHCILYHSTHTDPVSRPSAQTALLLPLFDLINGNPYFIHTIVNVCSKTDSESAETKTTLLTCLISFASYLFENNRTERTSIYARLLLTILLRLTEENSVMNYMARDGSAAAVRLCRQRSPSLPLNKSSRSLFCAILDDVLLFIRHNIRKRLDLTSYK